MKILQLLTLALGLFFMVSCQKEDFASSEKTLSEGEAISQRTPPDKAVICHLNEDGIFVPKEVPLPSVYGHLLHGDLIPDADEDGYTNEDACFGSRDDCNDWDATIHPNAQEIPDDGIDQDCDGVDEISLYCPCFSAAKLDSLLDLSWQWGWWSDVPGCKDAPYDQLLELWITNVGLPNENFNFSAQAGTINGNHFASSAEFNHLTGQFDLLCGGYTTEEIAEPCRQILSNFIQQLSVSHPDWNYCVRFP